VGPASIRIRITVIAVGAVIVVLAGVAVALVNAQRSQLTATIDATLRQRADDISSLLVAPGGTPEQFGSSEQEGFVQLIATEGEVIAASPNLEGYGQLQVDYQVGDSEQLVTITGLPVDDDEFRMLSRTVSVGGEAAVLHVGTTYDVVAESTASLTSSLLLVAPIVVLVLGALVWWLAGRTLRPVEAIRTEVEAIGSDDLSRRVSEPATGDEIASLAATMNSMLARIEKSVGRQQEFVADASHELRSPLTRMRTEIEVDLAGSGAVSRQRLESLLDEVQELQQLVEALLHLAREDLAELHLRWESVDLDDLVIDEGRLVRDGRRVAVEMGGVSVAQVLGDERQLRRAVHNLVDNASRHAESLVTLTLHEEGGSVEMVVVDDGAGIPADMAERVFERFTRLDDSRARSRGR